MSLYADLPARRTRQIAGDGLVAVWVLAWVAVGRAVHEQVSRLAAPGRTLEDAGRDLEDGLRTAGREVARTPVLGEELQAPFEGAGDAAASLAAAGTAVQDGVGRAALLAALAVATWPVVLVLGAWVLHRWRQLADAAVGRRLAASPAGRDLLALRALAHAPLGSLTDDDVVGWRQRDRLTLDRLAAQGARALGVRPPEAGPTTPSAARPGDRRAGADEPPVSPPR
ncbi:MAG: hypothetical protein H5T83_07965 [Actinotalea sp.]|nr:hypothetical protein [Actinotalea sp.]